MSSNHDTNEHIDARTWELLMKRFDASDDMQMRILKTVKEQNGRIGRLENWRWYIIGITTAVVVALKYLA